MTGIVQAYQLRRGVLPARTDDRRERLSNADPRARVRAAELMVKTAVQRADQRAGRLPVLVVPPPRAGLVFGADVVRDRDIEKKWAQLVFDGDVKLDAAAQPAPGHDAASDDETNSGLASFLNWNDNYPIMTLDEILEAAAEHFGLSVEKLTLAAQAARAAGETTQRAKPPRLLWNKDNAPDENPAVFAWRAYAAEAEARTLHFGVIRQEDEPLAVKLVSWLRSPANRKLVPEGFDIPTKPEWNTRQLAKLESEPARDVLRLYQVARKRRGSKLAA